jgi:hypothetical protein
VLSDLSGKIFGHFQGSGKIQLNPNVYLPVYLELQGTETGASHVYHVNTYIFDNVCNIQHEKMHKKLKPEHFCFRQNLAQTLPYHLTTQEHLPYPNPHHLPYRLLIFLISVKEVQSAYSS